MTSPILTAARNIGAAMLAVSMLAACQQPVPQAATPSPAAPAAPPFATRKINDNIYIFRYAGHQSMFVVGSSAVLAFDPISFNRPAAQAYVDEIKKITSLPIRYVAYSHDHLDHIAGGQPFKAAGAKFIGHRAGAARIAKLNRPDLVVPVDIPIDNKYTVDLGGNVKVDLIYVGRNHSDNMLVGLVPMHKTLFTVDFIPIETLPFRDFPDTDIDGTFASLDRVAALDWTQMIPGHPYAGGRLGTKQDVQNTKQYLTDLREAVREAFLKGRCYDNAMKEVKLPSYEKWGNYEAALPLNVGRMCEYFNTLQ